ncbi:hypothetical protein GA0116948_107167 [Chitinophaga costaii]|uniref:DUF3465 domain-containing protein n=1 Tax=Chitinophaga costaii TaxID=1335309 RepID=A0A1C4E8X6_9BACT|nr:hypothetical protein [Chitinophaga costaii]PUZ24245.1 hypothetical protein DCM91_12500 [Chitinophaga costaii]SCC39971.1 hypothetical protein GA0116948_107167 [Chitinophaga costaii]
MSKPVFFLMVLCCLTACHPTTSTTHPKDTTLLVTDTVHTVQSAPPPIGSARPVNPYEGLDTSDVPLPALAHVTTLALDTLQGLPEFTDGCVLMAAGSRKAFREGIYLLAGDFSVIVIKIKGTPVYLHISHKMEAGEDDQWYEGHGIKVHIHSNDRTGPDANDSIIYAGMIEVEWGNQKISIPVNGAVGC